jgi:hypothetical protein
MQDPVGPVRSLSSQSPTSGLGRRSQKSINELARRVDSYLTLLENGESPTVPRPQLAKMLRFDPLLHLHPLVPPLPFKSAVDLPPWKRRRRDAIEEEEFRDRCRALREAMLVKKE